MTGGSALLRDGKALAFRLLGIGGLLLLIANAPAAPAQTGPPPRSNVVPLVAGKALRGFNRLIVSVTICKPGTTECATIDNVMVDTGSTGLRLDRAALPPSFRLPAFEGAERRPLAECLRFVGSNEWGGLYRADLRLGGMIATALPIQIFEDDAPQRAKDCPRRDAQPTSNGTLGVSSHLADCFGACDQSIYVPLIYACAAAGCAPLPGEVPAADRLPNPVARLDGGRVNGLIFDLPAPPPDGVPSIVGTLTFGIGADQLVGSRVLRLDDHGAFTTNYDGRRYPDSYIDSGTGAYIFTDLRLPACIRPSWAFCVVPPRLLEAVMIGTDGNEIPAEFRVGDYNTLVDGGHAASDGLATIGVTGTKAFVWGAPFFLGKRVALALEGQSVPGAGVRGPFYAFAPTSKQ